MRAIDRSNVTSTILGGDKFAFDLKDGRSSLDADLDPLRCADFVLAFMTRQRDNDAI